MSTQFDGMDEETMMVEATPAPAPEQPFYQSAEEEQENWGDWWRDYFAKNDE